MKRLLVLFVSLPLTLALLAAHATAAGTPVAVSGTTAVTPALEWLKADSGDLLLRPSLPAGTTSYKWLVESDTALLIWIDGTAIDTARYDLPQIGSGVPDYKAKPKPNPKPDPPTPATGIVYAIVFKDSNVETPEVAAAEKAVVDALRLPDGSSRCRAYDVKVWSDPKTSPALTKYKGIVDGHKLPAVVLLNQPKPGGQSVVLEVVDEPNTVDGWKSLLGKYGEKLP